MLAKRKKNALTPQISDAEWIVMKVLWDKSPLASKEVIDSLSGATHWKPKTIHTLLRRLTDKGALDYEKSGREFVFRPLVSERDCQLAESRSFLDRVFGGGGVAPMVAAFVEQEKLTPEEIAELKRILGKGGAA